MGISSEITSLVKNRRAELWVCQRYDLLPGEQPHGYDTPASEAGLRYRLEINDTDRDIAGLYWNAIWFEGANSPILRTLREMEISAAPRRRLVALASEADALADVSTQGFLPVFVLPGLIESKSVDATYGAMGRRARESLAWTFARKVIEFPGTVLVVLGANTAADLELLWETLSNYPARDLVVFVAWSAPPETFPVLASKLVDIQVFYGTSTELASALIEAGAPSAYAATEMAVRVGKVSVPLALQDMQFVTKRLALLYESIFSSPGVLRPENLEAFFDASLNDWSCYSAGVLPVPRSYRTDTGLTLEKEVLSALKRIDSGKGQRTFILQIPAESASGVTTLLRSAAYSAAESGFPTLILRPDQVDLDIEDVLAFITALNDAALSVGVLELPPILLIIDVEHTEFNRAIARQVAQSLAAQGRKAVILQALSAEEERREPTKSERWILLPTLQSAVTDNEVTECARCFAALANDWSLGSEVHVGVDDWRRYHASAKIASPNGALESEALFWVALRYYVCEGATFLQQDLLRESLSRWIEKRVNKVVSEESRKLVNFVAAMSYFRLVSPLMTVLRPITGSVISSTVVDSLRQLRDIVDWKDYSPDLSDQVLTFRHPAIAHEYLRSIGVVTDDSAVQTLRPVIEELSPGSKADMWLAEMIAATILAPEHRRLAKAWNWRLEAFEWIPASVTVRSKAILHHWARCLSRSVSNEQLSKERKQEMLMTAIAKLEQALKLERRPGRDEHPSYILNTLGVVYGDMAIFLESQGEKTKAADAWANACNAFERSLALSPGENVIVNLAFSYRLLNHAGVWPSGNPVTSDKALRDAAKAIAMLDEAEEAISGMAAPEPSWRTELAKYKSVALKSLSGDEVANYIDDLKKSDDPSLGYYCEARLKLGECSTAKDVDEATKILAQAMDAGINLRAEALRFLAQLMRQSDTYRKDFRAQVRVYRNLERVTGIAMNIVDMFRLAVLCYQTNEFMEGSERFRKVREIVRQAQATHAPQRVTDFWQDTQGKNRLAHVRVDRVFSDWRGEGYVAEISQTVPLKPRHFSPIARVGEIRECKIIFEIWGPLAVPSRLDRA